MKSFQNLPSWAQALFVFLLLVAGISGIDVLGSESGFLQGILSSENSSRQSVEITIRDRDTSQPVANVSLQIIFEGPPVQKMTDRNGYVEIEIPTRDSVQVALTHQNYKTAIETINLQTDPNTTRVLYLDPQTP